LWQAAIDVLVATYSVPVPVPDNKGCLWRSSLVNVCGESCVW
jgi:hypothetical protein